MYDIVLYGCLLGWNIECIDLQMLYSQAYRDTCQPFVRTTLMSRYQRGKTNLDLLEQETVSCSGKSAP